MLAAVFDLDKGWHTYANAQNDSGSPLIAVWSVPAGVEVGEPIWTASHRHVGPGGILDHVYEGTAVVLFPVSVTSGAAVGEDAILSASLEWLVCDANTCVPQFAETSIELPIQNSAPRGADRAIFDGARQSLGTLLTGAPDESVILSWQGDTLIVEVLSGQSAEFIPGPGCPPIENLLESGRSESGKLALTFDFGSSPSQEVVGWIRLLAAEGNLSPKAKSTLYLIRLERGKKPARILGQ